MKPSYGDVTTSRSCSCSSCMYRSESDRPSVKQMLSQGSRIDKLYLGKYIPLRERKLLGKLVRTRAVYDDIRNQLLSESNLSVTEKADLNSKHIPYARKGKDLDDAERSSAILELVNLVDKGNLGTRRISECCSCCSCGSTIHFHEYEARHRHGRAHISSRSSMVSGHKNKDERRLRHVKYKAKHIRSDPCTCTSKFSGMIKHESKLLLKKLQGNKPDPIIEPPIEIDENQRSRRHIKGYKVKLSGMGESMRRSVTKIKHSQTKIANDIKAGTKKSLQKLREAEQEFKDKILNVRETVRKIRPAHKRQLREDDNVFNIKKDSLAKFREDIERKKILKNWECDFECYPDECVPEECFRIITRKRLRKRFRKSNAGNIDYNLKRHADISSASDVGVQAENKKAVAETDTYDQKIIGEKFTKKISSGTHVDVDMMKKREVKTKNKMKKNKNKLQDTCLCERPLKMEVAKSTKNLPSKTTQKISKVIIEPPKKVSLTKKYVSSVIEPTKNIVLSGKPSSTVTKNEHENKISQLSLKSSNTPYGERQAVRIGSSFSFSVEFFKDKHSTKKPDVEMKQNINDFQGRHKSSNSSRSAKKNVRTGGLALRRCFCTLKLKPENTSSKSNKIHRKVKNQSVTKNSQTMKLPQVSVILPYECEPMVCIPGECNPIKCEKIIHLRTKHHSTMTKKINTSKSTSSLTSKSVSTGSKRLKPNKPVNTRQVKQDYINDRNKPSKQVVRISSNFSFKVEFYKDKRELNMADKLDTTDSRHALKTKNKGRKDKATKTHKRIRHLLDTPSQITSSGKSKYTLTKHNLRRCFCTLKFAKAKQKVNRPKSRSTGTITSGKIIPVTARLNPENINKATEKKDKKREFQHLLLPYQCELGICVPGECNPYHCLEIINNRNLRTQTKRSGTGQRRTKSVYTLPPPKYKTVNMQSVTNSQKNKNVTKRRLSVMRGSLSENKQAVRIGSSFSFDVEFFKQKSPFNHEIPTKNLEQLSNKAVVKKSKLLGQTFKSQHKLSSVQVEKKVEGMNVQSVLERCFCTLKLHKINKNKKVIKLTSAGTSMAVIKKPTYPKIEAASKSTNKKNADIMKQLEPFECEPYFCIPGVCDPNQCLERIKKREGKKSKEFGVVTNTPRRKTTSSSTKNILKKDKNAGVQSYQKIKRLNDDISSNISEKSTGLSRQAVKIGSNFSFNIEFAKEISPKPPIQNTTINVRASKTQKHNGNNGRKKPEKLSQTLGTATINKATGIRPMLKKCFCTLKFQNKKDKINFPTAMTVLVNNQRYSTHNKRESKLKHYLRLEQSAGRYGYISNSFSSKSAYHSESIYSTTSIQKYMNTYQLIKSESKIRYDSGLDAKIRKSNLNRQRSRLIGVHKYLKSSYYAMNMQLQNKQNYSYKLQPYECEPGVCVPGQCNPVECQKLILKRLIRRASTMTSTDTRTQSISRSPLDSKSKKSQFSEVAPKVKKGHEGLKYKTLPSRTQKQLVRLGSSFNFNIEFSKHRTPAMELFQESKKSSIKYTSSSNTGLKRFKNSSTRGSRVFRENRTSQSAVVMQNKGSYIAPKTKRCFCTLKLQKKGRQSRNTNVKDNKILSKKEITTKTADVAQNTKQFKEYKIKPYSLLDLDPNECEPNVCVPGKCNPYECLERIKKREMGRNTKDFGTEMKTNKMSKSSITSSQKRATAGNNARLKEKIAQSFSKSVEKRVADTQRQVVRIGSSFSFDVEFYKDKSLDRENVPDLSSKNHKRRHDKLQIADKARDRKQKSIQDSKYIARQGSQTEIPKQHEKSTKTGSFLKRCFCTAKLRNETKEHKVIKTNTTEENTQKPLKTSPSFLKRCFCVLKSIIPPKTSGQVKPKQHEASTFVQTKNVRGKQHKHYTKPVKLEPYECEPGVCVPGECDPYICAERIKKRTANINKMSSAERPSTRSTSTFIRTPKISNASIQNKSKKSKPRRKTPKKSVVRIGSNFSFNVEFYKEKNPSFDKVQKVAKLVKETKYPRKVATKTDIPRTSANKSVKKTVLLQNRESQVDQVRKENKASGVAPMLKRCFCTLALGKQTFKDMRTKEKGIKIKMVTKGTETPTKKIKDTEKQKNKRRRRFNNLEPYECEPGVCVPEMCDPLECEKLIMKRHRKESGTETVTHFSKSATTMKKDIYTKHKSQNIKTRERHKKRNDTHLPSMKSRNSKINDKPGALQVVRIGSNFSFNIEFSKKKSGGINSKLPRNAAKRSKSQPISRPSISSKHQKTQGTKNVRHVDSQVLAKEVKSTVTEVAPFLKRCFCTLKLKNSEGIPKNDVERIQPIPKTEPKVQKVNKITTTANQTKKSILRTLEPYECEPGICVPGECDPHECLKRINKRMKSKMSSTNLPRERQISTVTSKILSAKRNQIDRRPINTSELRDKLRVKKQTLQSSMNSNRQAVRVGSNFSFNIEFFKDTSTDFNQKTNLPTTNSTFKAGKNNMIQKTNHHHVKDALSGNQAQLVNHQLQSNLYKTESKASGIGTVMKRCFCTLKLQNIGKQNQNVKIKPDMKMKDNSTSVRLEMKVNEDKILKDAGTRIKNKRRSLEPYECEPNTCIPGECNPLECYERIKMRGSRELGTDALRPTTKSVASLANDRKTKLKEIQTPNKTHTKSEINHGKRKRISDTVDNSYRQSVTFGSNFNFDIQFYKESSLKHPNNVKNQSPSMVDTRNEMPREPIKTKSQGLSGKSSSVNHTTQAGVIQESKGSGISPLLKRCFCTLTLHNTETNKITQGKTSKISTQNKSTSTKIKLKDIRFKTPNDLDPNECEPGICVPGQCDPYKCLERIKRRDIHRKSRTTGTCQSQCSKASFTTQLRSKDRSKRIQSELEKTPTIVEEPRFPFIDPKNWQGVRIGSNFSFNIEFYKENILPSAYNPEFNDKYDTGLKNNFAPARHSMKSAKTNHIKMKNCEIQTQKYKAENKASIAGNALKRCFCTAKLHQKKNQEKIVTVGRVDNVITTSPFMPTPYYVYQLKQKGHMCPVDCLKTEMKTASTKINNKYLDPEPSVNNKRQVNIAKNAKKDQHKKVRKSKKTRISSRSGKNLDRKVKLNDKSPVDDLKENNKHDPRDMKTILPYAPRKFNKNKSKTLLSHKVRKATDYCCSHCSCKGPMCKDNIAKLKVSSKIKPKLTKSAKSLSGKESKHIISQPHPTTTALKQFLCTCLQVFSKRKNRNAEHIDPKLSALTDYNYASNRPHADALKKSKSDRCPERCLVMDEPKKSKSLKTTKVYVRKEGRFEQKNEYSHLQSGDADQTQLATESNSKKKNRYGSDKSLICPHCQGFIKDGQSVKVRFFEPPEIDKMNKNTNKNPHTLRDEENTKIHPSYNVKGKALETNLRLAGILGECCRKWSECRDKIIDSVKQEINSHKVNPEKSSSHNSTINHNMSCRCCSCKSRKRNMTRKRPLGAKVIIKAKNQRKGQGLENVQGVMGGQKVGKSNLKTTKPCICGTSICAKESKKQKKMLSKTRIIKKVKIKPCICGSPVCDKEAKKMSSRTAKAKGKKDICECEQYLKNSTKKQKKKLLELNKNRKKKKLRKQTLQQNLRELAQRRKMYQKEDAARRRQRAKKDRKLMKDLKKYQGTSDVLLLAESVFDVAKLGCTTVGDVLRSTFRTVTDPKRTLTGMKTAVKNPARACKHIKTAISDSGVGSTFKRVKLRFGAMRNVKSAKTKLEECPATNYLIHINDKDPKKKHTPRKKKKVRIPMDFNCSLYMGSLRKKPWLAVYYACPWFYPHCLSMLNIWRQFTDIMLFLLAVVVWSPCIFLMEGCRAAMCCLLCTG